MTSGYGFSNSAPQAPRQLASLEAYLDPITTGILAEIGVRPGGTCLELGPGGGSISHWLARPVSPGGRVVAVDRDPSRLRPAPNLAIHRHDLEDGVPVEGPFDIIHARLVLLHLPQRHELLPRLAALLAPGGWLVLGEFSRPRPFVFTSRSRADADLYSRVMETLGDVLTQQHNTDQGWAHRVHPAMAAAGLTNLHTIEYAESWTGGGNGCLLHDANIRQKHDQLVAAGLTEHELADFARLMMDPRFSARSLPFVCTRGQKPAMLH